MTVSLHNSLQHVEEYLDERLDEYPEQTFDARSSIPLHKGTAHAPTEQQAIVRSSDQRETELRQLLAENLGGTLELSALQQRILHTITRDVALDGLHYHHEALDVDIRLGKQALHSCGYRLLCTNEYLGEIVFKRNREFTERELQLIEALIPAVVSPLRNSLRSKMATIAALNHS